MNKIKRRTINREKGKKNFIIVTCCNDDSIDCNAVSGFCYGQE